MYYQVPPISHLATCQQLPRPANIFTNNLEPTHYVLISTHFIANKSSNTDVMWIYLPLFCGYGINILLLLLFVMVPDSRINSWVSWFIFNLQKNKPQSI
jgi:hypothetical protein